jgi:predicted amidohydrolase
MSDVMIVASAQSRISSNVRENGHHARLLMSQAREQGAHLIHFPEAALSGYAKSQIANWADVDWCLLRDELNATAELAGKLGLWTVIGCNHPLTPPNLPHNCLYVLSDKGELITRYDKRMCSATEIYNKWYCPGSEPIFFDACGYRFGFALCIEIHFPHLFAEYEQAGVDCILFSSYAQTPMFGIQAQAHAATNCLWISLATPAQCSIGLPSGIIGPDGEFQSRASADGIPALAFGTLDRAEPRYDIPLNKARPWRTLVASGEFYRPYAATDDPRSHNRTVF